MAANFKASKRVDNNDRVTGLDQDPAYIKYLEQKAEEEQMMLMYEHGLEPC